MLKIDFLDGTIQIFIFYIILISIFAYFLLFSKKFKDLFDRLNKIHITKANSIFRLNYLAIMILIVIVTVSIFIIGFREARADNFSMFVVFAILSFYILPIAIGLLGLYSYIIKNEEYSVGSIILLTISFVCFGAFGSNLHDVLWCGMATDFYQKENLAGDDIYLFFVIFGIPDKAKTDYRIFGFYMFIQIILEITIGTIAFYQYYKLNKEYTKSVSKKPYILTYFLLFSAGALLGIVEFIFDYPWAFTDVQYKIDVYIGIPVIALLFFLIGYYLGKKNKGL